MWSIFYPAFLVRQLLAAVAVATAATAEGWRRRRGGP